MTKMNKYYESSTQLTHDSKVVIPMTDETARHALGYLLVGGIAGAHGVLFTYYNINCLMHNQS